MTPLKVSAQFMAISSTASTGANSDVEFVDMDEDSTLHLPPVLTSKKSQPSYKTRLFDDVASDTEDVTLTPKRRAHLIGLPRPLEPLDVNSSFGQNELVCRKRTSDYNDNNHYRKTPTGSRYRSESSDKHLFISPNSSYITMDGRCVTSKNPFSPMMMDQQSPHNNSKQSSSSAPFLPDSLDSNQNSRKGYGYNIAMPMGNNPLQRCRHRLQKRNNYAHNFHNNNNNNKDEYFTKDGYPERTGNYSFTGSPIKEKNMMDTSQCNSPTNYNFKLRRLNSQDDVVAASATTSRYNHNPLTIRTSLPCQAIDEVSPTDVLSFPSPPTPKKGQKRYDLLSIPTRSAPETPFLERRRRNHSSALLTGSGYFNRHRPRTDQVDEKDDASNNNCSETKSRFHSDFDIIGQLGKGSFGTVYKVLSRLDGCMYAVKAAQRRARGNADRDRMLKEVYALAALSDQANPATFHIVRYHQAWMEDNRLYIQTELCTSTLADIIASPQSMSDTRRYKLLREILLALEFIHTNEMVHLDIKPDNIFLKNDQFKLGDFGLVSTTSHHKDVEEGDSRYLPLELLSGSHEDLTKSDIFSLGATLYEICLGRRLPTSGKEWHDIRENNLQQLENTPLEMEIIIRQMMCPSFSERPSAAILLKRKQLLSADQKALIAEKSKVQQAKMELAAQAKHIKSYPPRTGPLRPGRGTMVRANTWNGTF